jgi:hypothetical protein
MSFINDIVDAKRRFPQHVAAFEALFRRYRITSLSKFQCALTEPSFRAEFRVLALRIAEIDGGKFSMPLLLGIIGAALGGVGIAFMGGAIGLPIAAIGAIGGIVIGSEMDSTGFTRRALGFFRSRH